MPNSPKLGTSFFVAFKLTHEALDAALRDASQLNITQYRVLVKLITAGVEGLEQKQLCLLLDLKANVISQAISVLEDAGLVRREGASHDKRARHVYSTDAGELHAQQVNDAVVEQLYRLFPTQDTAWRKILEAAIAAGAELDPPLSPEIVAKYPASRTLVSLELVRIALERELKATCGAQLSDCLVMMTLGESQRPLRINDVAESLDMPMANVTRAVDRLSGRGWVSRKGSPRDRKAVFVVLTEDGLFQESIISKKSAELGDALLWSKLSVADQEAIGDVGSVVIEGMRQRREQARNIGFDDLTALD